jgi:hypothetical protein
MGFLDCDVEIHIIRQGIVNLVGCMVAGMIGGLIRVGRGWVRSRRCAVVQGVPVPGGDHQPLRVAVPPVPAQLP